MAHSADQSGRAGAGEGGSEEEARAARLVEAARAVVVSEVAREEALAVGQEAEDWAAAARVAADWAEEMVEVGWAAAAKAAAARSQRIARV